MTDRRHGVAHIGVSVWGGGAVGATSWYETILLWPLHHPLLHPLGSPSCYSPSTPHLTGSVSADKGWHLLWSCSLDYAASTKPSTEKGTISPSVLRVGYAVVINTDDDNISRWSAVEESWTLSPAFLMRCNVIADFRVMGLKILSEGKGDWNSSREIGGKKGPWVEKSNPELFQLWGCPQCDLWTRWNGLVWELSGLGPVIYPDILTALITCIQPVKTGRGEDGGAINSDYKRARCLLCAAALTFFSPLLTVYQLNDGS